jgi:hypothetical protein
VPPGVLAWRAIRFGPAAIDDAELALLERLDGRTLGAVEREGADQARLARLLNLGLVILG